MNEDPEPDLYAQLMAAKPPGLSAHAWATGAGLSRQVFTDIRKRGNARHETVQKLLDFIGLTRAAFEAGARATDKEAPPAAVRAPLMAFRSDERPRDVPVVGTSECADVELGEDGSTLLVEAMRLDLDEVEDYVRRPLSLDNRREVYAIYFRGTSMMPRFEPGELGYVDPKRPAKPGEYVVVQLRKDDGANGERIFTAITKRLVRMSASFVEFEQFSPPATFKLERKDIAHIHRIIPLDELVAF